MHSTLQYIACRLDYETKSEYRFSVRVSDRGSPRLTSERSASVVVNISDENDSPPKFKREKFSSTILLPTFQGVEVVKVVATDRDSQSHLLYAISDPRLATK